MSSGILVFLCIALALPYLCSAFYLPGVSPTNWVKLDKLSVKAEQLSSARTHLPYEYFWLPFCEPVDEAVEHQALNLGEVLAGQRIYNSGYKLVVMQAEKCKILCRKKLNAAQVNEFATMIDEEYRVNFVADNLPVGVVSSSELDSGSGDGSQEAVVNFYEMGFPLGHTVRPEAPEADAGAADSDLELKLLEASLIPSKIYLYNHLSFQVSVFEDPSTFDGYRIVGFEVSPASVDHKIQGTWDDKKCRDVVSGGSCTVETCDAAEPLELLQDGVGEDGMHVIFSYDVTWKKSEVQWASRWDAYLRIQDEEVHWIVIVNSFMVVLFLTGLIASILIRSLKNDLARYQELDLEQDDAVEETGWKLVHADVFRAPRGARFFAILLGSGLQVGSMLILMIFVALLGFLSPANRGALLSTTVVLFALMGVMGGYHAARFTKVFANGEHVSTRKLALAVALFFPGIAFAIFFIVNLFIWSTHSSGAVPFSTILALACIWFGVSCPLVLVGTHFGMRKKAIEYPVRTNQIARHVPSQPWYQNNVAICVVGGVLPFAAVFVELFFVLSSLWLHQIYYLFGFLFLVVVILFVTCSEVSIVLVYFQICGEDYRWWWRSFLASGSCAFYLFIYSTFYYFTKLNVARFVSGVIYFAYMYQPGRRCCAAAFLTVPPGFFFLLAFSW
jgi:transmembrane 9 superfamily protein 2/4